MLALHQSDLNDAYIAIRKGYNPISREDLKYLRQTKKQHPNCVFLGNGRWPRFKINIIFIRMKKWNIKNGLFLQNNNHPKILRIISGIQFPKLKQLNLSENDIVSLVGISRIYAPDLTRLTIENNHITMLNDLRKCMFMNINTLSLSGNPIKDTNVLSEMKLNQKTEIWIGKRAWEENACSIENDLLLRTQKLENKTKKFIFFSQFLNVLIKRKQASKQKSEEKSPKNKK